MPGGCRPAQLLALALLLAAPQQPGRQSGNRMRFVTQAGALRVLYGMVRGRTPEAQLATQVLVRMQFG